MAFYAEFLLSKLTRHNELTTCSGNQRETDQFPEQTANIDKSEPTIGKREQNIEYN